MGKVQPVVDQGEPGKIYFNQPKVIEITSRKPHGYAGNFPRSNPVIYGEGSCRLESSHKIDKDYVPPKDCKYLLSRWPSKKDVDEYLEIYQTQGYDEGAIVCRRHQPLGNMTRIHRWGVILLVSKYNHMAEYKPYLVKWFADSSVEHAWGEDLLLIHQALDESMLEDIFMAQNVEINPASPL